MSRKEKQTELFGEETTPRSLKTISREESAIPWWRIKPRAKQHCGGERCRGRESSGVASATMPRNSMMPQGQSNIVEFNEGHRLCVVNDARDQQSSGEYAVAVS
ncbi:unnamed protein product [Linum trigynum]|uniref:Uncharacterized protein n=1 Tax=Linum trigynum TaxID=586398 RepID=A0AAV2FEC3_9ROSI